MRLMERPHITALALPRSPTWPSDLIPPHQAPFHFLPDVGTFAKFMLATPGYLVANLSREREQLDAERKLLQSGAFKDEVGLNFVRAADQKVQHQIDKALALDTPTLKTAVAKAMQMQKEWEEHEVLHLNQPPVGRKDKDHEVGRQSSAAERPDAFLSLQSQGFASSSSLRNLSPTPPQARAKVRKNINPPPASPSSYFFYQAANGAPVFLHPLDARILLGHFKSYAELPSTIEFHPTSDTSYTTSTINDEVRRRYKYLSHLPEGADVVFVEAGWDLEGIVGGAEGLRAFEGALKVRTGKRKEKEKKEERARVRAEEKERDSALQEMTTWVVAAVREKERSPSPAPLPSESATLAASSGGVSSRSGLGPAHSSSVQQPPGAWGDRSFATAIRGTPSQQQQSSRRGGNNRERERLREHEEDIGWELELDAAWHEFESTGRGSRSNAGGGGGRGGGGGGAGKKKQGKKLLVVTSGGRGRY